jgi:sporulation protein YlmC with PRC-barrel domain
MGTQVITRDGGRRLGVVGEVVVDIDRREVVALGLRDNPLTRFLPGLPRWMPLDRIRQVGDVILVDSGDSLAEGFDPDRYSKVINCQVVSESGVQLGRVLGFSFDIETGELTTLVIGALGVPLLGEGVLSTWELPVAEIVSSGTDRIVVYEGAEDKLRQLGTGLLEKLGIGGNSWEQEERDRFRSTLVPAENQLPAGTATQQEQRRLQPATSRAFEPRAEMEYVELEERAEREPLRQRRYLEEDQPERGGRGDWERPLVEPEERSAPWSERGWPEREPQREPLRQRGEDWSDRQESRWDGEPGDERGDDRRRAWGDDARGGGQGEARGRAWGGEREGERGRDEGRRQPREPRQERWDRDREVSRGDRDQGPNGEPTGPAESREDWLERSDRRQDQAEGWRESFEAGADRDPRRSQGLERPASTTPEPGRRPPERGREAAWRPDRSPPRAPGPTATRPGEQPVDVEPEVLDDPW